MTRSLSAFVFLVLASGGLLARQAPRERADETTPPLVHEAPAVAALEAASAPADLPVRSGAFVFPRAGDATLALIAATDPAALTFASDEAGGTYRTDFTLLARVRDSSGAIVWKASHPYRLTGNVESLERARHGEVVLFRQPTLPPGGYRLEVAAYDAIAHKAGVRVASFEVPPASELAVSSLIVVNRVDQVAVSEVTAGHPLRVGDVLLHPNVGESISKAAKALTLYLVVSSTSGNTPRADLELLHDGTPLARIAASFDAPLDGLTKQLWRLPLEAIPPGDYVWRVTVSDGALRQVRDASMTIVP